MTAIRSAAEGVNPSQLVAAEVRAELGRQGKSIRQLAVMLGMTQPALNRRLSPTRRDKDLTVDEVLEIAEALGVRPERLLSGWLPRLDSNQQPSDVRKAQVSATVTKLDEHRKRRQRTTKSDA